MSVTTAILSMALILDFSGSMEQKLTDRTKRSVLADNVSALASSMRAQEKAWVVSYGAGATTGCGKVEERVETRATLGEWVRGQVPGKFSATPLAFAIRHLESKLNEKPTIQRVLIMTDGNDTCKEDVCAAITELDKSLKNRKVKLKFDLLGYDLDTEEEKALDCGRLKLKQIKFNMTVAKTDAALTKALEKIESSARSNEKLGGLATITVQGAPPSVEFEIDAEAAGAAGDGKASTAGHPALKWRGPFSYELKPGSFNIHVAGLPGAEAVVKVRSNERKKLDFYRDFQLPNATVHFTGEVLGVNLEPTHSHPTARSMPVRAPGDVELAPGYWRVRVTYPWWVAGIQGEELFLEPGKTRTLNLGKFMDKQLKWLEPHVSGDPADQGGLRILVLDKGTPKNPRLFRIPVAPGLGMVPIPIDAKYHWE
jgi:hypothetical protein